MKTHRFPQTIEKRRHLRRAVIAAASAVIFSVGAAETPKTEHPLAAPEPDVEEITLEGLMQMKVTSVSKRPELLTDAASAVYVITQEDIRRSGATSIPEALRLSPGLEVARQDAHTWAISSRGFNDEFANQLLVLIDGRSVYTPLFAGVYWDVQDILLEDIDRIEVIRGPGATLWGANAVNGVINITTKNAKETQGLLVTGGGGTELHGFGGLRYGGKIGENAYYRVYGKVTNHDDSALRDGSDANDAWLMTRGGFRIDWEPNEGNLLTLQGDIYDGDLEQTVTYADPTRVTPPFSFERDDGVDVRGGNILTRWTREFSEESQLSVKLYYDRSERDRVVFSEKRDTFDADAQHRFLLGERQDVVWGLGYNVTRDSLGNGDYVNFDPLNRTSHLFSAFVQDEITIVEDILRLTLGTKLEHNDYTGWEVQPSGRLSWSITPRQTAWVAVSRAVSTPSRAEDDIRINAAAQPGVLFSLFGSRDVEAKELTSFELGYRIQTADWINLDFATFYNLYDRQRSIEPGGTVPPPSPFIVVPFTINNMIEGETYGFELASTFQVLDWWRIRANYSFLEMDLRLKSGGTPNPFQLDHTEGDSPQHQVGIRSLMDLPHNIELDTGVRYVDSLPNRDVPSYFVGDARIGWRPNENWEISVAGQNLFEARHQEFAPSYIQTQVTEVEASVYGKVTYRY